MPYHSDHKKGKKTVVGKKVKGMHDMDGHMMSDEEMKKMKKKKMMK